MPELPEVESARVLCEKHIVGATIVSVEFNEDGTYDEKIFKEIDESQFTSALKGRTVKAARRLGKHLWWDLGTRSTPLFHFGMTGAMTIKGGMHCEVQGVRCRHGELATAVRQAGSHVQ